MTGNPPFGRHLKLRAEASQRNGRHRKCQSGFSLKANLDAGNRCGFVFGEVQNSIKADHFQKHQHLPAWREEGALPASPLQGSEGPYQGTVVAVMTSMPSIRVKSVPVMRNNPSRKSNRGGRAEATHANEALGMVLPMLYARADRRLLSFVRGERRITLLWMKAFYQQGQNNQQAEAARLVPIGVKSGLDYS